MLRPAYRITVGDRTVDTTGEPRASTVVELVVDLDLDTPVDAFAIVQGQVGGLDPTPGDDTVVALGYAGGGELSTVLTGAVTHLEPGVATKRVTGHGAAAPLLHAREDRTFEQTTAGEIVRTLAEGAGVDVERVEDGVAFPAYVVDGRRSAAAHIRDLAALAGVDSYVTPQGRLVFEAFAGQRTSHRLRYAEHVLDVELTRRPPAAGSVLAWGESPGGSRGDESWAWLTKDFTPWRGSAGTGEPVRLLERPVLRTAAAAQAAAGALQARLEREAVRGRVLVQGRAEIRLGDAVVLAGFPSDDLDGTYQVRSVRHRITKAGGFTTEVGFRSIGGQLG